MLGYIQILYVLKTHIVLHEFLMPISIWQEVVKEHYRFDKNRGCVTLTIHDTIMIYVKGIFVIFKCATRLLY